MESSRKAVKPRMSVVAVVNALLVRQVIDSRRDEAMCGQERTSPMSCAGPGTANSTIEYAVIDAPGS